MSDNFYVRNRGHVLGPYSPDELKTLAQRGQFSRLHEVSEDGVVWRTVASYPHLLPVADAKPPADPVKEKKEKETPPADASSTGRGGGGPPAFTASAAEWFYDSGGKPTGPVEWGYLQYLVQNRQVAPDTLVWKEGRADWMPARAVPGLILEAASPLGVADRSGSRSESEDPPSVSGLAVTSLAMGIVGLVLIILPGAFLLSLLASIFGGAAIVALKTSRGRKVGRGMALGGLVTGIVGLGIFVVCLVYVLAAGAYNSAFWQNPFSF